MVRTVILTMLLTAMVSTLSVAQEKQAEATQIEAARGSLTLEVPSNWTKKQAASRIIEHEYSAPPAEGDKTPGRLTMMSAGGSVKANVDRWRSQFVSHDVEPKIGKKEVAGMTVHSVDLQGTYNDRPRPFGPGVRREDYRMLGVIVEGKAGLYFLKFYGPKPTIEAHEKAFQKIIDSIAAS